MQWSHAVISGVVSRKLSDLQDDWLIQNDFKLGGGNVSSKMVPIIVSDYGIRSKALKKDFLQIEIHWFE